MLAWTGACSALQSWKSELLEIELIAGGILSSRFFRQIQHIYDNTSSEFAPVGYLPANNRDAWAKVRQGMIYVVSSYLQYPRCKDYALLHDSVRNRQVLDALESCAFVVSLDSEKPEGPVEFSRSAWHGGVAGGQMGSRWCATYWARQPRPPVDFYLSVGSTNLYNSSFGTMLKLPSWVNTRVRCKYVTFHSSN
jgi:hypothetical protein